MDSYKLINNRFAHFYSAMEWEEKEEKGKIKPGNLILV